MEAVAYPVTAWIMVTVCWDKMFIREWAHFAPHTSLPTPLMKTAFPQTALKTGQIITFLIVLNQQPTYEGQMN